MTSSKNHKSGRCPICDAPTEAKYAPFCSRRCADVDLHKWLSGGYGIPAHEDDELFEGEPEPRVH